MYPRKRAYFIFLSIFTWKSSHSQLYISQIFISGRRAQHQGKSAFLYSIIHFRVIIRQQVRSNLKGNRPGLSFLQMNPPESFQFFYRTGCRTIIITYIKLNNLISVSVTYITDINRNRCASVRSDDRFFKLQIIVTIVCVT